MDLIGVLLIAGAVGAAVGAALVYLWRIGEPRQDVEPETPVSEIPEGADKVLSVLSSSAVLVDNDCTVVRASAPAYALGLVQGDQLVASELLDLVRAVRRDGQVRESELTLQTRGPGLPRHVAARVAPLSPRLMVVLVDDRTGERRVEAIRRDFVANVSHELKTPVGALNLLAEAVHEARDDPEAVSRFSGRMTVEAERLGRLVQQIIELSRLQGNELIDEPVDVDVKQIVAYAVEHSATEAERRDVRVMVEVADGLTILGDPDQLQTAVSNLVENAVGYSEEGTRVGIIAKPSSRDADQLDIIVTDQGIGIPAIEQERIFERFYRVDPARHRSTGGTGLGLSIVKHVAASHGGTVNVWSRPGEGSTFTLTFPAYQAPASWDVADMDPPSTARRIP